jgi:hypothetical protein
LQLFYRREHFAGHLKMAHATDDEQIRELARKQRIGRNCQTQFWCGFCKKILPLKKNGIEGSDERFDHIDKHFKDQQNIKDWMPPGGTVAKGQALGLEDVLGEDGISEGSNAEEEGDDEIGSFGGSAAQAPASAHVPEKRTASTAFGKGNDDASRVEKKRNTAPTRNLEAYCHKCLEGPALLELCKACVNCNHHYCRLCKIGEAKARARPFHDDDHI